MPTLFLCEKASQAKDMAKCIGENDAIILCPSVASYVFRYPENLKFSELPYSSLNPNYVWNPEFTSDKSCIKIYSTVITRSCVYEEDTLREYAISKLKQQSSDLERGKAIAFLKRFSEISFACDSDHTGVRGFDFMFQKYFGINDLEKFSRESGIKITACVNYRGFDSRSITIMIENRVDYFESQCINSFRASYKKKDFLDYNYNCNSLLLLNKIYFLSLGKYPDFTITRNYIQALFIIKSGEFSRNNIYREMDDQKIGSPASRSCILERLTDMRLVESTDNKRISYSLSESGNSFVGMLNRRLNDPHLAQRSAVDVGDIDFSLEGFKEKYGKYLAGNFQKQKRLLNKIQAG